MCYLYKHSKPKLLVLLRCPCQRLEHSDWKAFTVHITLEQMSQYPHGNGRGAGLVMSDASVPAVFGRKCHLLKNA